ncbi:MAG: hypothetical protein V4736_08405 [Bdellovibrionota bacterium]
MLIISITSSLSFAQNAKSKKGSRVQKVKVETPVAPKREVEDNSSDSMSFNNARENIDLMYISNIGDRVITGTMTYGTTKTSIYRSGALLSDVNSKSTSADFEGYYGITENSYVGISSGYKINNDTENTYGPAAGSLSGQTITLSSDGLEDVTLKYKIRLLHQQSSRVNFNIGIDYSPKLMDHKGATSTSRGDVARGGDLTTLSAEIGNKYNLLAYSGVLTYSIPGTRSSEYSDGSSDSSTGGNALSLQANLQYTGLPRFTPRFGIATISYASTSTQSSTGTTTTINDLSALGFNFTGIWTVIQNQFYLAGSYSRIIISGANGVGGSTLLKVDDQILNTYTITALMNF